MTEKYAEMPDYLSERIFKGEITSRIDCDIERMADRTD